MPKDCRCRPGYSHATREQIEHGDQDIYDNTCHPCSPIFHNFEYQSIQRSACAARYHSIVDASRTLDDCEECEENTFSTA